MTRVRIVPAVLTESPADLAKMVRQAELFTDYVQLDIMDGEFVPSRSISVEDMARLATKLRWEAHLMVKGPEKRLEDYRRAEAEKVIIHYEATPEPETVIITARKLGLGVGLAVNPETPVRTILPLMTLVDSVLFLSVHPGFYGARFIPEVLDKIADFRRVQPGKETGIDGGVKEGNIADIARTGVDTIYVGSAIFLQPDPGEAYRRLVAKAGEASR